MTARLWNSGAITKSGNGILELDGANSYGGGTTISGGTLLIGGAGSLGTAAMAKPSACPTVPP